MSLSKGLLYTNWRVIAEQLTFLPNGLEEMHWLKKVLYGIGISLFPTKIFSLMKRYCYGLYSQTYWNNEYNHNWHIHGTFFTQIDKLCENEGGTGSSTISKFNGKETISTELIESFSLYWFQTRRLLRNCFCQKYNYSNIVILTAKPTQGLTAYVHHWIFIFRMELDEKPIKTWKHVGLKYICVLSYRIYRENLVFKVFNLKPHLNTKSCYCYVVWISCRAQNPTDRNESREANTKNLPLIWGGIEVKKLNSNHETTQFSFVRNPFGILLMAGKMAGE